MSNRNMIVVAVLLAALAGAAWWFFHENPEAEVRKAHQEFAELLSKQEGEATSTTVFGIQVLQTRFADTCEVSGEAEMFGGSYTPEGMASTIMRVRGMFRSIELTFHDLMIGFPAADDAIVNFTAALVAEGQMAGEGKAAETREVVSRMRKIEGKWRFAEFRLEMVSEN